MTAKGKDRGAPAAAQEVTARFTAVPYLTRRHQEIGTFLRQHRQAMDMTRSEVAKCLGTSQARVARVEDGESFFSLAELEILERLLDFQIPETLTSAPRRIAFEINQLGSSAEFPSDMARAVLGQPIAAATLPDQAAFSAQVVSLSPGGRFLAAGEISRPDTGLVYVWEIDHGMSLRTIHTEYEATKVAFDRSGRYLAVGDIVGDVTVWDISSDAPRQVDVLVTPDANKMEGVEDVAFGAPERQNPDRVPIVSILGESHGVCLGVVPDLTESAHWERLPYLLPMAAAFAPDGKYLAVGTDKGIVIRELDQRGGLKDAEKPWLYPLTTSDAAIRLAYSPDGRYLAVESLDYGIDIWEVTGGAYNSLLHIQEPQCYPPALVFTPANDLLSVIRLPNDHSFWLCSYLTGRSVQIAKSERRDDAEDDDEHTLARADPMVSLSDDATRLAIIQGASVSIYQLNQAPLLVSGLDLINILDHK